MLLTWGGIPAEFEGHCRAGEDSTRAGQVIDVRAELDVGTLPQQPHPDVAGCGTC